MENNIDYRDIVQTVTSNILEDVKSQFASIQPGIVDDIVKRIEASIQPSLDSFANQLDDLQRRVLQLEQNVDSSTPRQPLRRLTGPVQPLRRLTPTLSPAQQKLAQGPDSSETANTLSDPPQIDTQTRILLLKIGHWPRLYYNDWIIYLNKEDGHTYLIRKNGTDQKDISSYFINKIDYFDAIVENGSDWIIEYCNRDTGASDFAVIPMP